MTLGVYEQLRLKALAKIDGEGLDPADSPHATKRLLADTVEAYQTQAQLGHGESLADPDGTIERLFASVIGTGPLFRLLGREDVEEVFVEGDQVSYLKAGGALQFSSEPTTEAENRQTIERLIAETDRRLDAADPVAQARVMSGSARLTAVIPPISDHLSATIRRYALRSETLSSLVELGSLNGEAAAFLSLAMRAGASIVVSGPPGSGKTSFLSALIAALPPDRCIRASEEVRELHVPLIHGSYYEARPPSLAGVGAITLRDLVKVTLAMRPDLIVVGEVRGAEAFELTRASNAGCAMACTVHANSASDALDALVNAALMAGENIPNRVVQKVFANSIDLVVHLDRRASADGAHIERRTAEIRATVPSLREDFSTTPLFERSSPPAPLVWTGSLPPDRLRSSLESIGVSDIGDVMEKGELSW